MARQRPEKKDAPHDWKPMHTAPRDGTVVDLYTKSGMTIRRLQWDGNKNRWKYADQVNGMNAWAEETEFVFWAPEGSLDPNDFVDKDPTMENARAAMAEIFRMVGADKLMEIARHAVGDDEYRRLTRRA